MCTPPIQRSYTTYTAYVHHVYNTLTQPILHLYPSTQYIYTTYRTRYTTHTTQLHNLYYTCAQLYNTCTPPALYMHTTYITHLPEKGHHLYYTHKPLYTRYTCCSRNGVTPTHNTMNVDDILITGPTPEEDKEGER